MRVMGKVIQFEERAVAKLRDRLGAAESANEDLIAFARGHSGATASIHAAVLTLMDADSLKALFDAVTHRWPFVLGVDQIVLAMVVDGQGFLVRHDSTQKIERRLIDKAIEESDPITMRTVERGHSLFGGGSQDIRSEALVLLPAQAPLPYGLLLLGQSEGGGADTAHGAQLLGFLGDSLGAMIRRWLIDR